MKSTMDKVQCTKQGKRTFEKIIEELAARLTQYGWSLYAREAGCFRDDWGNFLTISKHDGFEIKIAADELSVSWYFKSEELAAIASACTEIAALRKEEQQ